MATILVIAISSSGAADAGTSSAPPSAVTARTTAPVHCASARRATRFYQRRHHEWKLKTGVVTRQPARLPHCPRNYAQYWKAKALEARRGYYRWFEHEYAWWKWLPDKFRRVGRCETGGTPGASAAGNWSWDSGTYVSAFGIIRAAFPTWNGHNTPREQYEVAADLQARYGWGAWGCGGA